MLFIIVVAIIIITVIIIIIINLMYDLFTAVEGCWQQKEHSTGLWIERGEAGRWGCANVRYTLAARGKHTESCQGLRA